MPPGVWICLIYWQQDEAKKKKEELIASGAIEETFNAKVSTTMVFAIDESKSEAQLETEIMGNNDMKKTAETNFKVIACDAKNTKCDVKITGVTVSKNLKAVRRFLTEMNWETSRSRYYLEKLSNLVVASEEIFLGSNYLNRRFLRLHQPM